MPEDPKVLIAILNWNGHQDTIQAVRSASALIYTNSKIIVIDNGSQPQSRQAIRDALPDTPLVETGSNLGYAGGNNIAFDKALYEKYDFIWILNNDLTVAPDSLNILIKAARENPQAALLGPRVFRSDKPQTLFYPGWKIDLQKHLFYRIPAPQPTPPIYPVDYIQGCSLLVRAEFIAREGGFDHRYHLYCEDADLALRARTKGWQVLEVRDAHVWHKGYGSTSQASPLKTYYGLRNRLLFIVKHAERRRRIPLVLRLLVFDTLPGLLHATHPLILGPNRKKAWHTLRAYNRAAFDFIRSHFGPAPPWLFPK